MATIDILDASGKKSGTRDLSAELFEAHGERAADAPGRRWRGSPGCAPARTRTKTRGEVRGGGKKPWRQKGTGRARQGSIRSPAVGRRRHRPRPAAARTTSMRVNKKMRKGALRSALTDALQSGKLAVVDDLSFDEPKTKQAVELLDALELDRQGRSWSCPSPPRTAPCEKSFRNLRRRAGRLRGRPRHLRPAVGRPRAVHGGGARRARGRGREAAREVAS